MKALRVSRITGVSPINSVGTSVLFLAKIRAAIRPEPSAKQRAEVHERTRILAAHNAWLTQVLDHHDDIEAAFEDVQAAITPAARREAQHWLATLLTGHSLAEEASIYPEIARRSHAGHSAQAFHEQGATKLLVARLEKLDPASPDYVDELARLHTAVTAHTYWEERDWFPALREQCDAKTHLRLLQRYRMEFDRYVALETLLERVRRDLEAVRSLTLRTRVACSKSKAILERRRSTQADAKSVLKA